MDNSTRLLLLLAGLYDGNKTFRSFEINNAFKCLFVTFDGGVSAAGHDQPAVCRPADDVHRTHVAAKHALEPGGRE